MDSKKPAKIPIEEKKAEAIRRMKAMGVFSDYITRFEQTGKVCRSEPPFGALYDVDAETRKALDEFEAENNALVYLVIHSNTTIGKMDSYLFVSDKVTDWDADRADIKEGVVFTYTFNYDAPDCSEFGLIGFVMGPGAAPLRAS